jgi:drug/metabolite transporter (DMT)-like permease
VFLIYAFVAFREVPRWNTLVAMGLIVGAVYLTFQGRG